MAKECAVVATDRNALHNCEGQELGGALEGEKGSRAVSSNALAHRSADGCHFGINLGLVHQQPGRAEVSAARLFGRQSARATKR